MPGTEPPMTRRRPPPFFLAAPVAMALAACGDDGGPPQEATGTSGTGTDTEGPDASGTTTENGEDTTTAADSTGGEIEPPPPLPWTDECTFGGSDLSRLDPDLQCAGIEVPLDWDDLGSESLVIAAYKLPTTAETRRGQLWLLDGGPGSSGLGLVGRTELTMPLREAGWDVLVPAHRGTLPGLDCPSIPILPECRTALERQWGEGLRHFNSSQAAHDLAHLVERERQIPDDPVVVYGVSYGTMWGMHYASLHPDQPDGLVLDSVLPSEVEVLTEEEEQQISADVLMQRCIDDPDCGVTLPHADGAEFSTSVVAAIDEDDCGPPDGGQWVDAPFRTQLGALLNGSRRDYVPLMSALLAACTPETTALYWAAIPQLLSFSPSSAAPLDGGPLFGVPPEGYDVDPTLYFSTELQYVVMGTTVLRDEEDPTPYTSEAEGNLVGLGFADTFHDVHDVWTTLPDVALLPPYPAELPTLTLAGRFDQQTPLGWALQTPSLEAGGSRSLLVFDAANHGVIFSGVTEAGEPCARDIMLEFAAQPTTKLDLSCMDDVPDVDPTLQRPDLQDLSIMVFGTDDPWSLVP